MPDCFKQHNDHTNPQQHEIMQFSEATNKRTWVFLNLVVLLSNYRHISANQGGENKNKIFLYFCFRHPEDGHMRCRNMSLITV